MAGRSCLTNLLEYLEVLTDLVDQGLPVDVVYLDFQKAFDKVPHQRLAMKCDSHGIVGKVMQWITEWLSDRQQRVVLNGKCSAWKPVLSGVPQGSVLGPTLFLIYINDIDQAVDLTHALIKKFADDTKLAMVVQNDDDRALFQRNIDGLIGWSAEWQMLFNIDKCHIMHFGRNNQLYSYQMNGEKLEEVVEEKDVGVLIHSSLKPSAQCAQAAKKGNQVLGQLYRAVTYRDKVTFKNLYCTYVRPHLEYAVQAWSPWTNEDINLLEQVQRRMVRSISGLKGVTYEDKLTEIGLTTLEARRRRGDLIEVYKIMTKKECVDPKTWFDLMFEMGNSSTRNAMGHLNIKRRAVRLDCRRYFFSVRVWQHWNELDDVIKQAETTNEFKCRYDRYVKR